MIGLDTFNPPPLFSYQKNPHVSLADFRQHELDLRYSEEVEHLKEAFNLTEGWDSYSGKAPDKNALKFSFSLLAFCAKRLNELKVFSPLPEFCLAPDGIMGIEWDYEKNSNVFARIHSAVKIECVFTNNNEKTPKKEMSGEEFKNMCREKLESLQAA